MEQVPQDNAVIEREREMMNSPARWSTWPMLPLVKRNAAMADDDYCGFLFADGKLEKPIVYLSIIWMVSDTAAQVAAETGKPARWNEILSKLEQRQFDSLDALFAAYRVD